jgi:hypothetical protein
LIEREFGGLGLEGESETLPEIDTAEFEEGFG